ncbi:MAG: hypothetical protein QM731_22880 [Chitinophagaceae bacterium]
MKRNKLVYIIGGLMLMSAVACKKNNVAVDQDITPPEAARFVTSATVSSYYIQNITGGSFYKIPVGITTVSNVDRKVQLVYSSSTGAVNGTQYKAPTTFTIAAGKALDSLAVEGVFAAYPTGRKDTVTITITAGDGFVNPNAYNKALSLIMQKYCNVVLADLQGDYTNTRETNSSGGSPYGPYTSGVTLTAISGSSTSANVIFHNFWDSGIEATGTVDWADPANFKVSIPYQYSGLDYAAGQPIYIRTSPTVASTFSSCDQSFTITADFIVVNYPSAGSSAYYAQNYKIYIKR